MAVALIAFIFLAASIYAWPYRIYRNYLTARKTGLRILLSPATPFQISWHISYAIFGDVVKRQKWFRALDQTCAWQDKNKLHEELGPCFMHVSPGMNMLCTNDAVAIENAFKKVKEFVKPEVFKTLDFFGPNIITVNDEPWARHRKLTAPCFNERVSAFVWDESMRQANDMLADWLAKPDAKTSTFIQDAGTVALHVIGAAAFGEHRDFREGVNKLGPNHTLSFRESLNTVLRSPVTSAAVGNMPWLNAKVFQIFLSSKIKKVQLSLVEFKRYMEEAITRERENITKSPNTSLKRPNLLHALVRASDEAKAEGPRASTYMSDDELTGNMFMFAFAGHETTATTISYAICFLAIHPELQDWVAEELDLVVGHAERLDYADIQPKLKRTLALVYETVRLFGVPPPWRSMASSSPEILLSNPADDSSPSVFPIPPNTQVSLNVYACHTSATSWVDPLAWNPKRWIASPSGHLSDETFIPNYKAFFGWGWGPRVCPGQKFAQVEFAAVLAVILTRYKILPALEDGVQGGEEKARENIVRLIADSIAGVTVNFSRPEDLCVRLVER